MHAAQVGPMRGLRTDENESGNPVGRGNCQFERARPSNRAPTTTRRSPLASFSAAAAHASMLSPKG
jgi:hypothetical protein